MNTVKEYTFDLKNKKTEVREYELVYPEVKDLWKSGRTGFQYKSAEGPLYQNLWDWPTASGWNEKNYEHYTVFPSDGTLESAKDLVREFLIEEAVKYEELLGKIERGLEFLKDPD